MLVERYGALGGLATGGLIILLLTLDDGDGEQVIGGLCQEIVDRIARRGGAFHPPAASGVAATGAGRARPRAGAWSGDRGRTACATRSPTIRRSSASR